MPRRSFTDAIPPQPASFQHNLSGCFHGRQGRDWSMFEASVTKEQPLFGERDTAQRHTSGPPSGGLGPRLRHTTTPATFPFGGLEQQLVKSLQCPLEGKIGTGAGELERPRSNVRMEISLHGQWKGLRGHGNSERKGTFKYPLFGDAEYTGQLLDGRRHGKGMQVSHRGVFKGEFRDGDFGGTGRRDYCDGTTYTGQWKDGYKHGHGELLLANKDRYVGEFDSGKMHGHGAYFMHSGDIYEGNFVDGQMEGEGKYKYGDSRGVYRGEFIGNEMHGKGTLKCQQDDETGTTVIYAGEFQHGKMSGKGFMRMTGGDSYDGGFADGVFDGYGEYTYADGARYFGEWHRGMMHGFGTYSSAPLGGDVETYTGMWAQGKRHGQGVAEILDGVAKRVETQEGTWFNGLREGRFLRTYSWGTSTYEEFSGGKRVAWSRAHGPETLTDSRGTASSPKRDRAAPRSPKKLVVDR